MGAGRWRQAPFWWGFPSCWGRGVESALPRWSGRAGFVSAAAQLRCGVSWRLAICTNNGTEKELKRLKQGLCCSTSLLLNRVSGASASCAAGSLLPSSSTFIFSWKAALSKIWPQRRGAGGQRWQTAVLEGGDVELSPTECWHSSSVVVTEGRTALRRCPGESHHPS